MTTLNPFSAEEAFRRGTQGFRLPDKVEAPTTFEPTPYWAWELHHGRRMDLARTASRLGITRHAVLALLGQYKPIADAMLAKRMRLAPVPRIDQVDPRARETFIRMGELLGIKHERAHSWDPVAGEIAARMGADHYVDGMTLWLWHPEAETEAEQRASGVGIHALPEGQGYRLLDGCRRETGKVPTVGEAEAMAGLSVRRSMAVSDLPW